MENKKITNNFVKALEQLSGTNESFAEQDYPILCEVLETLASEYDFNLTSDDINYSDESMHIDGDGFPYIEMDFEMPKLGCKATIMAYHHTDWDFYIENFELLQK